LDGVGAAGVASAGVGVASGVMGFVGSGMRRPRVTVRRRHHSGRHVRRRRSVFTSCGQVPSALGPCIGGPAAV